MASRRVSKSSRFNEKVVEDIRSKQAQAQAQKVAQQSFNQNERIKLAQQQQASQSRLRQERSTRASEQIKKAQQVASQAKQRSQQISQQNRSKADTGFIPTVNRNGRKQSVSVSQAQKLANQIRQREQQQAIQEAKQRQIEAKQIEKPINTTSLDSFARSFTNPPKPQTVSKGRSSQFGQQVSRGSIGQQVSKLEPPIIRGLTDEQRKSPQFLGGEVKSFLTEDKKERFSFGGIIPSVPQANAEEFPESQNVPRERNFIPFQAKPEQTKRVNVGDKFVTVIPNPNTGRVVTTNPDGTPKEIEGAFTKVSGTIGTQTQKDERPPVSRNFVEGFFEGAKQEAVNFGNVVDVATGKEGTFGETKKEVGSTIVDLPFAVGGALITKEAEAGKGFGGLGFDFDLNLDRAVEKGGKEIEFIGKEFERDPARAIGSTVTAVGTEVALFVGTAGTATVARKGIVKTAQFVAKTKQHKLALKVAKELNEQLGEKNVPFVVERIGKSNTFEIIRGGELGKKAITVIKGTDQGIIKSIGDKGQVIIQKIPKIYGIGRKTKFTKAGSKQKLDPSKTAVTVESNESSIPLAIVKFSSKKGEDPKLITFTKEIPKKNIAQTRGTTVLEGVTGEEVTASRNIGVQIQKGFKPFEVEKRIPVRKTIQPEAKSVVGEFSNVGGRQFTKEGVEVGSKNVEDTLRLIGKPTKLSNKQLDELSDTNFIQTVARGSEFNLKDFVANPKAITSIAKTGNTIKQQLPKTTKELKALQKQGINPTIPVTKARVTTFEIFSTKTEGVTGKLKGLPKVGKEAEFVKGKKITFGDTGTKVVSNSKGRKPSSNLFSKQKPQTDIAKTRQTFSDITKQKTPKPKSKSKSTTRTVPKSADDIISATSLGARSGIIVGSGLATGQESKSGTKGKTDFGNILIPLEDTKQKPDEDIISIFPPKPRPDVIVTPKQDTGLFITPIQTTIPETVQVPEIVKETPNIQTTPPTIFTPPIPSGRKEALRRQKEARARKSSKTGNRLFDVAETPFGKVEVGLGFFIEQKGNESIAEAIGTAPLKKKKKKAPDNVFDPSALFEF